MKKLAARAARRAITGRQRAAGGSRSRPAVAASRTRPPAAAAAGATPAAGRQSSGGDSMLETATVDAPRRLPRQSSGGRSSDRESGGDSLLGADTRAPLSSQDTRRFDDIMQRNVSRQSPRSGDDDILSATTVAPGQTGLSTTLGPAVGGARGRRPSVATRGGGVSSDEFARVLRRLRNPFERSSGGAATSPAFTSGVSRAGSYRPIGWRDTLGPDVARAARRAAGTAVRTSPLSVPTAGAGAYALEKRNSYAGSVAVELAKVAAASCRRRRLNYQR